MCRSEDEEPTSLALLLQQRVEAPSCVSALPPRLSRYMAVQERPECILHGTKIRLVGDHLPNNLLDSEVFDGSVRPLPHVVLLIQLRPASAGGIKAISDPSHGDPNLRLSRDHCHIAYNGKIYVGKVAAPRPFIVGGLVRAVGVTTCWTE